MELSPKESHWFCIAAFRYCLGRSTYIVSDMTNWLENNWLSLLPQTQDIIKRDIYDALRLELGGDDVSKKEWHRFLEWAIKNPGCPGSKP